MNRHINVDLLSEMLKYARHQKPYDKPHTKPYGEDEICSKCDAVHTPHDFKESDQTGKGTYNCTLCGASILPCNSCPINQKGMCNYKLGACTYTRAVTQGKSGNKLSN